MGADLWGKTTHVVLQHYFLEKAVNIATTAVVWLHPRPHVVVLIRILFATFYKRTILVLTRFIIVRKAKRLMND